MVGVAAPRDRAARLVAEGDFDPALYRALVHLPATERFTWRAGEGCRSSMRAVFEAIACDTPFAFRHFDDPAWRQLVIKALFVEAPLWRVYGLDQRLDEELARMALDLAEEIVAGAGPGVCPAGACAVAPMAERLNTASTANVRTADILMVFLRNKSVVRIERRIARRAAGASSERRIVKERVRIGETE